MPSKMASLVLTYHLKLIGLNAYYRENDRDVACPLCGCVREDYSHFAVCSVLGRSEELKIDDLYSNYTDRITREVILIEERLKQRDCCLLLTRMSVEPPEIGDGIYNNKQEEGSAVA